MSRNGRTNMVDARRIVAGLLCAAGAVFARGADERAASGEVRWIGAQHAAVHDGDVESKIRVDELAREPHLFALGPVEGLHGEIIVVDGRGTIATVESGAFRTRDGLDVGAAFLVWTHAERWNREPLPEGTRTLDDVEKFLARVNEGAGAAPIAFRIEGRVKHLRFHVLRPPEHGVRNAEDHEKSKVRGSIADRTVRMVGFYSGQHRGVFTPGTSDVHVHFVTEDGAFAGHVEEFELAPGAEIIRTGDG